MNKLGVKIKNTRIDRKLSRNELAKRANITSSALSNYENGYRTPNNNILENIAAALSVDINYLLGKTKFKDFEGEQLRTFETIIEYIINCSDGETVKSSVNIIENLAFLLNGPIVGKRVTELKILNEYIELLKDVSSILESNNIFYRNIKGKDTLSISDIEVELSNASNRFSNITSKFYGYSNDLEAIKSELLNSSLHDDLSDVTIFDENIGDYIINENYKTCSFLEAKDNTSKVIDVNDFSDDEIKDIEKYISFIRYNRNNNI